MYNPKARITITCIDNRYGDKPQKTFTLTGDWGREDLEEIEALKERCFERTSTDRIQEYQITTAVEGA